MGDRERERDRVVRSRPPVLKLSHVCTCLVDEHRSGGYRIASSSRFNHRLSPELRLGQRESVLVRALFPAKALQVRILLATPLRYMDPPGSPCSARGRYWPRGAQIRRGHARRPVICIHLTASKAKERRSAILHPLRGPPKKEEKPGTERVGEWWEECTEYMHTYY
jgi:hypothetical protein